MVKRRFVYKIRQRWLYPMHCFHMLLRQFLTWEDVVFAKIAFVSRQSERVNPLQHIFFLQKICTLYCMMFITPSLEIVSINAGQRQNCNSRWRFSSSYSVYFIIGSGLSSGRTFGHQNLSLNSYDMIQSFERFAYGTYNTEGHHRKKKKKNHNTINIVLNVYQWPVNVIRLLWVRQILLRVVAVGRTNCWLLCWWVEPIFLCFISWHETNTVDIIHLLMLWSIASRFEENCLVTLLWSPYELSIIHSEYICQIAKKVDCWILKTSLVQLWFTSQKYKSKFRTWRGCSLLNSPTPLASLPYFVTNLFWQ